MDSCQQRVLRRDDQAVQDTQGKSHLVCSAGTLVSSELRKGVTAINEIKN